MSWFSEQKDGLNSLRSTSLEDKFRTFLTDLSAVFD